MGAVVAQVAAVLGRGHALFGDPPSSGGVRGRGGGQNTGAARGSLVRSGQQRMSGAVGSIAPPATGFSPGVRARRWTGLAGADERLSGQLQAAADADRAGRGSSGAVVSGAAADTAGLAPYSATPAGQKALLTALRARVAQQQQVVRTYQDRAAQMAALLRSMAYAAPRRARRWRRGGDAARWRRRAARRRRPDDSVRGLGPAPAAGLCAHPRARAIRAAIERALDVKGIRDPRARAFWTAGLMTIASRESGFDPNAVNDRRRQRAARHPVAGRVPDDRPHVRRPPRTGHLDATRATRWPRPPRSSTTCATATAWPPTAPILRRGCSRPTRPARRRDIECAVIGVRSTCSAV